MKRGICIALLVLVVVLVGWALTPSPIDPVAWTPPPEPAMDGPWQPNNALKRAELLAKGEVKGPEAIAVDAAGNVYAGLENGWIVRLAGVGTQPPGARAEAVVERWVNTGGRPLGMAFDQKGNLIVADAWKGLISIAPDKTLKTLATEAAGVPFGFTDDLDIASDGTIYFSDASSRFNQPDFKLDLLENRPHGRLLKYEPATGEVVVLLPALHFANGVAVDPQERFVLVNETWRYRVLRHWLAGGRAGATDVFADNLPGFPDNLSRDQQGRYWLALPTLRNAMVDRAHPHPWLKQLMAKLPESIQPQAQEYGLIAVLGPEGEILASFHDTEGKHLQEITSVEPVEDFLYLGSLHNDRIGRLALSELELPTSD